MNNIFPIFMLAYFAIINLSFTLALKYLTCPELTSENGQCNDREECIFYEWHLAGNSKSIVYIYDSMLSPMRILQL